MVEFIAVNCALSRIHTGWVFIGITEVKIQQDLFKAGLVCCYSSKKISVDLLQNILMVGLSMINSIIPSRETLVFPGK